MGTELSRSFLASSVFCRRVEKGQQHLLGLVAAFFRWFDNAWQNSSFGKIVMTFGQTAAIWGSTSVFMKFVKWFFGLTMDHGNSLASDGAVLGLILGLGAFVPTGIQLVCFLVFLFILLWTRAQDNGPVEQKTKALWLAPPFQVFIPLTVLFVFVAGATVSSVVPGQSAKNLVLWIFNALVLLTAFDIAFRGKEDSIAGVFLTFITASSLVALYQNFSGWQPPRSWLDTQFEDEIVRVVGTFSNPNYLAEMIGLALPIAIALILKNKRLEGKAVMLAYTALQGGALIFTWTRGAWLGFLASFGIMAVLFDKRLLIVGLIAVMLVLMAAPPVIAQRLLSSFTLEDSSNSYRISIWRGSIALIKDNFFRGIGLGPESFAQLYPEYMIIETPALHAHSIYFQILIELGLFGFIAFLWFLSASTWYSLKAVFSAAGKGFGRWGSIGVLASSLAAVAGHMIQGIIDHTWYNPQIMLVVWAWLGVAAGIAARLRSEGSSA